MLSSLVDAVIPISIAAAVVLCFAIGCATFRSVAKTALSGTDSADRPQILRQLVALLKALFSFPLRRK